MKKKSMKQLVEENKDLSNRLAIASHKRRAMYRQLEEFAIKTNSLEETEKELEEKIQQNERDLHVLESSKNEMSKEIERLKQKSNEYYFELEALKKKKFKLPKINWAYLNYLYFLPLVVFVGGGIGLLTYLIYLNAQIDSWFVYVPLGLVAAISAPILAAKGEQKLDELKEAGLL